MRGNRPPREHHTWQSGLVLTFLFFFLFSPHPSSGNQRAQLLLKQGIRALDRSDYPLSLRFLNESLKEAKAVSDRQEQAQALLWMARRSLELNRFQEAIEHARRSRTLSSATSDQAEAFAAYIVETEALFHSERKLEAQSLFETLDRIQRKTFPPAVQADFYLLRGEMLRVREEFDPAGKNMEEALRLAGLQGLGDRAILAASQKALLSSANKEYAKAHEFCWSGLERAARSKSPFLQASLLKTEGDILTAESRYKEAIASFLGALSLFKASGNPGKEVELLLRIVSSWRSMSSWEKARQYCHWAASISRSSQDTFGRLRAASGLLELLNETTKKADNMFLKGEFQQIAASSSSTPSERAEAFYLLGILRRYLLLDPAGARAALLEAAKTYCSAGDRYGQIRSLVALGSLLDVASDEAGAQACYDRALNLRNTFGETIKLYDKDFFSHYNSGTIIREKGFVFFKMARYEEAKKCFGEALKADASPNRIYDRILDLHGFIITRLALHDFEGAQEDVRRAFAEIPNLTDARYRAMLYNLIMLALFPSNRSEGLQLYDETTFTGDTLDRMMADKVLGDPELVARLMEAYRDWIKYEQGRKNLQGEGVATLFQGAFYGACGRDPEALDAYARARDIFRKANVPFWEGTGRVFAAIWLLRHERRDAAIKNLEEALAIFSKAGLAEQEMSTLHLLGTLSRQQGNFRKALDLFQKNIALARKSGSRHNLAAALIGRALTLSRMKDCIKSLESLLQAEAIVKKTREMRTQALILIFEGRDMRELGLKEKALTAYRQALDILKARGSVFERRDASLELGSLLEEMKMQKEALEVYNGAIQRFIEMRETLPSVTARTLSEQKSTKELFERAISLLLRQGRYEEALEYVETSRSVELAGSLDVEHIKTEDPSFNSLLMKYRELQRKTSLLHDEIEGTQDSSRAETLSRSLAGTRQDFFVVLNEIRSRNPDFGQLLSVQGAELDEIRKTLDPDTLLLEYYPAPDKLYIFLVSADDFKIRVVEATRERLYNLVLEARKNIAGRVSRQEAARLLYNLLLAPVMDEAAGKKRLLVIPGGLLWYLPLEVLPDENGEYFLAKKEVSYLSSSDILRLFKKQALPSKDADRFVAFGAPAGANLPLSEQEVKTIGKFFPGSKVFTGEEATKERFLKEVPGADILHIATHSSLNRQDVNNSYIRLAGKDGDLFLSDIYGIRLKGSSLAVLSSCESALGEENPGREFASLANAFGIAGASSVIASLWEVEDTSTALLFTQFYENLREGKTISASLRAAKLGLLKNPKTAHPFFWGGFVLLGDWR